MLYEVITYKIIDRYIAVKPIDDPAKAQQVRIKGTVKNEAGEPLPGVTVIVKGTTQGTIRITSYNVCYTKLLRVQEGRLNMFFRDDGLSDLIGFTYGEWHADDAVGDLINHLVNIADACKDNPQAVVSIIMDRNNFV